MRNVPDDYWWEVLETVYWTCLGFLIALVLVLTSGGCTVRSVTTCLTYDRALQRPDPNTGLSRDAAGASVCVESGPREPSE